MRHLFDHPAILALTRPFSFRAGDVILLSGEIPETVYLLQKGEATVRQLLPDGNWRTVHALRPEQVFGELEMLTGQPHVFSVFARTDCSGICLAAEKLTGLLQQDAAVCYAYLQKEARLVRDLSLDPSARAGNTVLVRVTVCLAQTMDKDGGVSLTREEIAAKTGSSVRGVYRALAALQRSDMIKRIENDIYIPDKTKLYAFINSIQVR